MPAVAFQSELSFPGGLKVAADAVATTQTPIGMRPQLGSMANLAYVPARAGYLIRLSAAATTGVATLRLTDGVNTIVEVAGINLSAAQEISDTVDYVDLAAVKGQSRLYWECEITSAADAGVVAEVFGRLELGSPLTVAGC